LIFFDGANEPCLNGIGYNDRDLRVLPGGHSEARAKTSVAQKIVRLMTEACMLVASPNPFGLGQGGERSLSEKGHHRRIIDRRKKRRRKHVGFDGFDGPVHTASALLAELHVAHQLG
jgi:hypothetical protein